MSGSRVFKKFLRQAWKLMAAVSNMAKDLATDAVGNAPTHVPPSAVQVIV